MAEPLERQDFEDVAAGWSRFAQAIAPDADAVSRRLVEVAELRAGQRVLDLACGIGDPTIAAARAIAPDGRVVAIDASPTLVALARTRAAQASVTNIDFACADADDYAIDGSFDAVLSRWGIMFVHDLDALLTRIRAHLKPGGRFAASTWPAPPAVPMISFPMSVARERGYPAPPAPPVNPFALADAAALVVRVEAAGFTDVVSEEFDLPVHLPSAAAYVEHIKEMSHVFRGLVATLGSEEERRAYIDDLTARTASTFGTPEGGIRFPNRVRVVSASA